MTSHASNIGAAKGLGSRAVSIIGQNRFQNELLAFYLKNEIGVQCSISEIPLNIAGTIKGSDRSALLLIECPGKDPGRFLSNLKSQKSNIGTDNLVALFNVEHGGGIEEKAVTLGIKGIFYDQDPVGTFKKGIEAIFNGELWISRDILSKYVMKFREKHNHDEQDKALLTSRETEILTMISMGTKNSSAWQ